MRTCLGSLGSLSPGETPVIIFIDYDYNCIEKNSEMKIMFLILTILCAIDILRHCQYSLFALYLLYLLF